MYASMFSKHQSDDEIHAFLRELKGSASWFELFELFEREISLTRDTKSLKNLSFCVHLIRKEVESEVMSSIDASIYEITKAISSPTLSQSRKSELQHQIDFLAHLSDVVSNHGFPATLAAKCVEDVARRNRAGGGHSESSSE